MFNRFPGEGETMKNTARILILLVVFMVGAAHAARADEPLPPTLYSSSCTIWLAWEDMRVADYVASMDEAGIEVSQEVIDLIRQHATDEKIAYLGGLMNAYNDMGIMNHIEYYMLPYMEDDYLAALDTSCALEDNRDNLIMTLLLEMNEVVEAQQPGDQGPR